MKFCVKLYRACGSRERKPLLVGTVSAINLNVFVIMRLCVSSIHRTNTLIYLPPIAKLHEFTIFKKYATLRILLILQRKRKRKL